VGRSKSDINALSKSPRRFSPFQVGWTGKPAVTDQQETSLKTRTILLTLARCGLTLVRNPLRNLVPVLVPVRTGILFTSMQRHAISSDVVCAVCKWVMLVLAKRCNTLQSAEKQTQNPPVMGVRPPGTTSRIY